MRTPVRPSLISGDPASSKVRPATHVTAPKNPIPAPYRHLGQDELVQRGIVRPRYPVSMTIALGVMASTGMVIASDSEVSADMTRITGQKIFVFDDDDGGRVIVTGSGNTHYLQNAAQRVGQIFRDNSKDHVDDLEATFQAWLEDFYETHVLPFQGDQTPDIALVIGANRRSESRGWVSELNLLNRWHVTYAAVGIGAIHAKAVLGTITHGCDFESAKIMAAYVVWLVKQRVAYCGKDTHIQCFSNDGPSSLSLNQIHDLERIFSDMKYLEAALWAYVFGSRSASASQEFVYKFIEDLRRECAGIISPKQ